MRYQDMAVQRNPKIDLETTQQVLCGGRQGICPLLGMFILAANFFTMGRATAIDCRLDFYKLQPCLPSCNVLNNSSILMSNK
jgi:hypothetical protein